MTNTEHCTCTCTCCNTVPASCWCGKNRNEATGPVAPDEDRPVEKETVWEVMVKTSSGPITTSVRAAHMRIDNAEPATFDFWNGEGDSREMVAVFLVESVVWVQRA